MLPLMTANTPLKKSPASDMDWEDLMALIRKRRWSLRQIALREGYAHGNVLGEAKRRPYPKVEAVLASYAGIDHPMKIWPSRYDANGKPNRAFGPKPRRHGLPPVKATTRSAGGTPQKAVA